MENLFLKYGPQCTVCGTPVSIGASKANERGQALHSECAVKSTNDQDLRHSKMGNLPFRSFVTHHGP